VGRTVGWFTTVYPVRLEWDAGWSDAQLVERTQAGLREMPGDGSGYGVLAYGSGARGAGLRERVEAEVGFNYLGQLDRVLERDSRWRGAEESSGATQDRAGQRSHLLEINAAVVGGKLWVRWGYSQTRHDRSTIQRVAQYFAAAVRRMASRDSDPVMDMPPDEIEALLAELEVEARQ